MKHEATLSERADQLEHRMTDELNTIVAQSALTRLALGQRELESIPALIVANPGRFMLMRDDPRLPMMPERPTLVDFFRLRFLTLHHLLQSATHALKAGLSEKMVLACLLHDIAVVGFLRGDHGYWGEQLVAPYVDEEVSWAIRMHQALRFYPDEAAGYDYPELYIRNLGPHYRPEPYIETEYKRARAHKWYMSARMITVYDVYSFDPGAKVDLGDFIDIIGRNFKQPEEGLGFDNSPCAHMWRTMIWPTRYL